MKVLEKIDVICFGREIGRLAWNQQRAETTFQYNPDYLTKGIYSQLIPETGLIKRIASPQVFRSLDRSSFRGLPSVFADSLPDEFGNKLFKTWIESQKNKKEVSAIEQLTYVAHRGMGAWEYKPVKSMASRSSIRLDEVVTVLKEVLESKENISKMDIDESTLLTLYKIGTSAGGVRPKVLISENISTGRLIPGDINHSADYHHYLVKLHLDDELGYHRERIEYAYYKTAIQLGIEMSESKLMDEKHFATIRFDRINGKKIHVLTASGLTGWDFKDPLVSSYENLFDLALFLKLSHVEIEQLFKRMIFNIVFANLDDHLKNHSFCYDPDNNNWHLAPAYDITYALNPLLHFTKTSRALSINGKRTDIIHSDLLELASKYTIRDAKGIIKNTINGIDLFRQTAKDLDIEENVVEGMVKGFWKAG